MRKFGLTLAGAATALVAAVAAYPAYAIPAAGSFSFGQGVSVNTACPAANTAGCITSATTSKTFLQAGSTVNAGATGNLGVTTGETITAATLVIPLTAGPVGPLNFTIGTLQFSFTTEVPPITLVATPAPGGAPPGNISTAFAGIFHDTSGNLDNTTASLSESCTQVNTGSAIGCTETITVPSSVTPPPGVPEPASLALLGSALVGFGLARRRRRSA